MSARRQLPAETHIVVPFAGSGSECVAAYQMGCKFIGYEINETAIGIAAQRLMNAEAETEQAEEEIEKPVPAPEEN